MASKLAPLFRKRTLVIVAMTALSLVLGKFHVYCHPGDGLWDGPL